MRTSAKYLFAVFLIGLSALSAYKTPQLQTFRDTSNAYFSDIFQKLALPYHLARLETMKPDKELIVPISGLKLRNIADTWGGARSGGRLHEGIDMFAKKGTPVFSATSGYVAYVGTNQLGGNVVFVFGAGGIRYYYAHLDSAAKDIVFGKEVATTTILGYVGNTGNATGTPPHLHFGMYKNGAENPYKLLVPRKN